MELNGLTLKRQMHPFVVNVCVHSLLVTLRFDGVGVLRPGGGRGGVVIVAGKDSWLDGCVQKQHRSALGGPTAHYSGQVRL